MERDQVERFNTPCICDLAHEKEPQGGTELLVVQYCREDADFTNKKITKIGQKMPMLSDFAKKFTKFLGYAVCRGENYGGGKKVFITKNNIREKIFCEIFLFFENIF